MVITDSFISPVRTSLLDRGNSLEGTSCVVTHYNQSGYIRECVQSLLVSSGCAEIVLVDDFSAPGERAKVEEICAELSVRPIFLLANGGVSDARMHGLSVTSGEFVMFLDGDDVLGDQYLSRLAMALHKDPDASFALGVQHFFSTQKDKWDQRWPCGSISRADCWQAPCLSGSGVLFRRSALLSVGGFRSVMSSRFEDWDLGLRLMLDGRYGLLVQDAVYHYRRHVASLMGRIDLRSRAIVDAAFALRYREGLATSREAIAMLGRRFFPLLLGELRAGRLGSTANMLSEARRLSGCGWLALVGELPTAWKWYVNRHRLSDA